MKNEIQHVVLGNFYPLQPISAVILAIIYKKLGFSFELPLLIYGAMLIFLFTVYLSYHFFANITPNSATFTAGDAFLSSRVYLQPMLCSLILKQNAVAISLIYFEMGVMFFPSL